VKSIGYCLNLAGSQLSKRRSILVTIRQTRSGVKLPKKTQHTMSREATAYHEAGHAVAAWCLGYRPSTATIIPGTDSIGQVRHENPFPGIDLEFDGSNWRRLRIERAIMICLAGPIAQRRYRKTSWRRWHGGTDYVTATELALRVSGSSEIASAFLKWLNLRTALLVDEHWRDIKRIAIGLLTHGSLAHEDIASLMATGSSVSDSSNTPTSAS
jgi:hypothetical protein